MSKMTGDEGRHLRPTWSQESDDIGNNVSRETIEGGNGSEDRKGWKERSREEWDAVCGAEEEVPLMSFSTWDLYYSIMGSV